MNSSVTLQELATALAKAQGSMRGALKDSANPFFKSRYADLSSVVEAIREPLSLNGLSYVQLAHDSEGSAKIETIILHSSGEWLSCGAVSVPVSKADAQGFGSAMTYARRYSLSAAFGVAPEDDDGNAAAKAAPKKAIIPSDEHGNPLPEKVKAFEAPHKPTGEAYAKLSPDMKTFITDLDSRVRMLGGRGDIQGACAEADETLQPYENRNDLKTALWELMADVSTLRNAMKKHWANALAATQI